MEPIPLSCFFFSFLKHDKLRERDVILDYNWWVTVLDEENDSAFTHASSIRTNEWTCMYISYVHMKQTMSLSVHRSSLMFSDWLVLVTSKRSINVISRWEWRTRSESPVHQSHVADLIGPVHRPGKKERTSPDGEKEALQRSCRAGLEESVFTSHDAALRLLFCIILILIWGSSWRRTVKLHRSFFMFLQTLKINNLNSKWWVTFIYHLILKPGYMVRFKEAAIILLNIRNSFPCGSSSKASGCCVEPSEECTRLITDWKLSPLQSRPQTHSDEVTWIIIII